MGHRLPWLGRKVRMALASHLKLMNHQTVPYRLVGRYITNSKLLPSRTRSTEAQRWPAVESSLCSSRGPQYPAPTAGSSHSPGTLAQGTERLSLDSEGTCTQCTELPLPTHKLKIIKESSFKMFKRIFYSDLKKVILNCLFENCCIWGRTED